MADTVTVDIIQNLPDQRSRTYLFTNHSAAGAGESAITKVNISDLPTSKYDLVAPTKVRINRVDFSCSGMQVLIAFAHTSPDTVLILDYTGSLDFTSKGGIVDPASAGGTGDITFTTINHGAGDSYTVEMEIAW